MSLTPEGKVKTWLDKQLKKRYPNIWFYKAPGGRFGKAGTPDVLCCIDGHFVAIEVKAIGGTVTLKQSIEQDLIRKAGGMAVTIYGKAEEVFETIDQFIHHKNQDDNT